MIMYCKKQYMENVPFQEISSAVNNYNTAMDLEAPYCKY